MEPGPREPAPTLEEVEQALKYTKDGKAIGPDDIPIELLKLGGDSVVKAMHRIRVRVEHWQMAGGLDSIHLRAIIQETTLQHYVLTIVRYL